MRPLPSGTAQRSVAAPDMRGRSPLPHGFQTNPSEVVMAPA